LFHGTSIADIDPCELRRRIGYLFQVPHLFEGSVTDNIRYAHPETTDENIRHLAERIQIEPSMINSPIDNLSEGEKQRVAIARLLATNPEVILLDEPTSALDPTRTEVIENLVRKIVSEDGITALMVTHIPEQAVRMGGDTLLLVNGSLVEHGPSGDVVNNPQTEQGRQYREKKLS
jgi:putative ABC transport system ATP-binding protein